MGILRWRWKSKQRFLPQCPEGKHSPVACGIGYLVFAAGDASTAASIGKTSTDRNSAFLPLAFPSTWRLLTSGVPAPIGAQPSQQAQVYIRYAPAGTSINSQLCECDYPPPPTETSEKKPAPSSSPVHSPATVLVTTPSGLWVGNATVWLPAGAGSGLMGGRECSKHREPAISQVATAIHTRQLPNPRRNY